MKQNAIRMDAEVSTALLCGFSFESKNQIGHTDAIAAFATHGSHTQTYSLPMFFLKPLTTHVLQMAVPASLRVASGVVLIFTLPLSLQAGLGQKRCCSTL